MSDTCVYMATVLNGVLSLQAPVTEGSSGLEGMTLVDDWKVEQFSTFANKFMVPSKKLRQVCDLLLVMSVCTVLRHVCVVVLYVCVTAVSLGYISFHC